ncbi:MAG: dihydroneopterin aldolase [Rikenellaceae bacterium]|nr:dihydroneopterin aldolase [Rikenellaceae bacterium]
MYVIELENMEFRAFHGCYELERKVGNRFSVDVVIESEETGTGRSDDLAGAVNYLTVYRTVAEQMEITSHTLERVCTRIIDALLERWPQVVGVKAKVSKLAPPLGGKIERVSVTMTRRRESSHC